MKNGIFKLDWASIGDAVLMAVIVAIITALVGAVGTTGFNVFAANWIAIGQNMVNLGFIAGVITLGQNFLSTDRGSILNIGPENNG